MTVIAWDGRYVAADSLKCYGSSRAMAPVQKLRVRDGIVFACTGSGALFEPMIQWYLAGKDPEKVPPCGDDHKGTTLIVFTSEGACFYKLDMPHPEELSAPDAWGAGADFAIGAMEVGADAKTAVEAALRRETYTGGPVQVIDLAELRNAEKAA
jgi:hypothetical protein